MVLSIGRGKLDNRLASSFTDGITIERWTRPNIGTAGTAANEYVCYRPVDCISAICTSNTSDNNQLRDDSRLPAVRKNLVRPLFCGEKRQKGQLIMLLRRSRAEWAIPLVYAITAFAAGLFLPRIEHRLVPELASEISVPVALSLFSSITSGMLAMTGIVFSLAFVMVQFSAVAYSPRLVLWVSRDPVIWHSIGIFTATFLYAIGAIAWVDRSGSGKVPFISGWLVILLTLASVAMFVALIQRIGLLQVNRMLAFTGDLGRRAIQRIYPPLDTRPSIVRREELAGSDAPRTIVYSGEPQTLQAIDMPALLTLSERTGGSVEVLSSVGDTLTSGTSLMRVFGGNNQVNDEKWTKAFQTGPERSFEQDPKYAIRLLVDIAIKALSPAVNDPTTAVQALDQIQDLLTRLGQRRLEIGAMRDSHGNLRLVVPHPSWEDFLRLAFDEIRACGATSLQVMRRMRALMGDLISTLPEERRPAVEHQLLRLNATIARSFVDEEEKVEASKEDRQGLGLSLTR